VSRREESLRRTEKEIIAEKAATLGRAGERLEAALELVTERRRALEQAPDGVAREEALARYRQARAHALDARRTLIIQREAIGLRTHRVVDQQFPEPPALG
jgi:hypothetical protein